MLPFVLGMQALEKDIDSPDLDLSSCRCSSHLYYPYKFFPGRTIPAYGKQKYSLDKNHPNTIFPINIVTINQR